LTGVYRVDIAVSQSGLIYVHVVHGPNKVGLVVSIILPEAQSLFTVLNQIGGIYHAVHLSVHIKFALQSVLDKYDMITDTCDKR